MVTHANAMSPTDFFFHPFATPFPWPGTLSSSFTHSMWVAGVKHGTENLAGLHDIVEKRDYHKVPLLGSLLARFLLSPGGNLAHFSFGSFSMKQERVRSKS